ncbi:LysR family transcriptional regulator [Providencia rustigianii]|uniref:LysR family transcriptional regulator n=1 Tax=Providencia rustigianii TaxID=158850 RepID=UPI000F70BD20|nr:LysR family transcriptional regulator [Providencia rustigianii]MTC61043.1 LysR family transcriptional regulator [Providencia rustigianii]VEH55458.1 D-malate degradation protein R [Providencia rustigianii]
MRVDLNLLRIFVAVASQGSFANAAKLLSMPTSNISRAIKQLEAQLNCQLIERTTRQMRLTEQGALLLKKSHKLYSELEETLQQIRDPRELSGTLRLTIPSESGSLLLAELLARFAVENPKLAIHCDTQLVPLDVISDDIDLLLTFHRGDLADSRYHSKLLKSWESVVVASPELIKTTGLPKTISQLSEMPCISSLSALHGQPWIFLEKNGQQKKVIVTSQYRVNSGMLASVGAINGLGYAILSKEACQDNLQQGKLVEIHFENIQPAPIELRAVYATRRSLSPIVDKFLSYLTQNL